MKEWRRAASVVLKAGIFAVPPAILLFGIVHPEETGVVSRWDGSCTGWTHSAALLHIVSDVVLWWAYVAIATAVGTMHPVMNRVRSASLTVILIASVFLTCGATHLLEAWSSAWSSVWSAYWATGAFKAVAAIIGICGAVFVTHDLRAVSILVACDREELERHRQRFEG